MFAKSLGRIITYWPIIVFGCIVVFLQRIIPVSSVVAISALLVLLQGVLILLSFGVSLSAPYFFEHAYTSLQDAVRVVLTNAKRLILPGILVAILLSLYALVTLFVFMALFQTQVKANPTSFFSIYGYPLLISGTGIFIFAFCSTFPVYFSLMNMGFFKSLRSAVSYGFTHLRLALTVGFFSLLWFLLAFTITIFFPYPFLQVIVSLVGITWSFFITSYSYEYWKTHPLAAK